MSTQVRTLSPACNMNQHQELVTELKKSAIEQKVGLFKRLAEDINKPSRQRRTVNLFSIEQHAADGETVVVPGKVLGEGDLTKKVTVVALSFSESAKEKINKSGKSLTLTEFMKQPTKKVRLLG
ncbi:MAG: 50S ribosomal protein L18e [Candidatus Woesearchaeota archaeon]|nr:50S ribosomal protein L18e [Candidatus Woesearchaeota archaeon]